MVKIKKFLFSKLQSAHYNEYIKFTSDRRNCNMNLFSPAEIARNFIATGKTKGTMPIDKMFVLAIMAGIFIGVGGISCTTIGTSVPLPSIAKFVGAAVFPGALIMVTLAGGELFTGNCLMPISIMEKEITVSQMLKNWVVVYLGNFVGTGLVAAGIVFSHSIGWFNNAVAVSIISTTIAKHSITFGDALIRGIFCNLLVCLAVWIAAGAKDVTGKITGIFFPVMMFVLCGFEHCIANMYFCQAGLFAVMMPEYANAAIAAGLDISRVTWANFAIGNLIPVTIGNIIGGAGLALVYWYAYLKK